MAAHILCIALFFYKFEMVPNVTKDLCNVTKDLYCAKIWSYVPEWPLLRTTFFSSSCFGFDI